MLAGDRITDVLDDDLSYVLGLGLIREQGGQLEVANPIYREAAGRST